MLPFAVLSLDSMSHMAVAAVAVVAVVDYSDQLNRIDMTTTRTMMRTRTKTMVIKMDSS